MSPLTPQHDVTVYSPASAGLFRRSIQRTAGAERQMTLLARELTRQGHQAALVVYPVLDPIPDPVGYTDPPLKLIERDPRAQGNKFGVTFIESARVVRALDAANGRVTVVRTGNPVVGFIALWCLFRRRRFIFSSASNLDFMRRANTSRLQMALYRFGVRRADAVVVQSVEQIELARRAFPKIRELVHIPSFAAEPSSSDKSRKPEAFVWAGRLVDYKRPLAYADLAAAVPEARFVVIPHVPQDSTSQKAMTALEEAASRLENLEIHVELPHAELVEKLAYAVAVVNTSPIEGMPNTFLEAWAQGIPVLTLSFDPDGVIEERGLGVAADGSWDRFVAGARELWDGRFERDELTHRVREHVRATHSIRVVGAKWEELLGRLGAFEAD